MQRGAGECLEIREKMAETTFELQCGFFLGWLHSRSCEEQCVRVPVAVWRGCAGTCVDGQGAECEATNSELPWAIHAEN